jgi:hypothetical protein
MSMTTTLFFTHFYTKFAKIYKIWVGDIITCRAGIFFCAFLMKQRMLNTRNAKKLELKLLSNFYREFSDKSIFRHFLKIFKNYKKLKFFLRIRIAKLAKLVGKTSLNSSVDFFWKTNFQPKLTIFGFALGKFIFSKKDFSDLIFFLNQMVRQNIVRGIFRYFVFYFKKIKNFIFDIFGKKLFGDNFCDFKLNSI